MNFTQGYQRCRFLAGDGGFSKLIKIRNAEEHKWIQENLPRGLPSVKFFVERPEDVNPYLNFVYESVQESEYDEYEGLCQNQTHPVSNTGRMEFERRGMSIQECLQKCKTFFPSYGCEYDTNRKNRCFAVFSPVTKSDPTIPDLKCFIWKDPPNERVSGAEEHLEYKFSNPTTPHGDKLYEAEWPRFAL